jgi:hypothetical protein
MLSKWTPCLVHQKMRQASTASEVEGNNDDGSSLGDINELEPLNVTDHPFQFDTRFAAQK